MDRLLVPSSACQSVYLPVCVPSSACLPTGACLREESGRCAIHDAKRRLFDATMLFSDAMR
ncbi:hypothetical protein BC831DRAFT_485671 [Entophlyctis helioformis]|nr:hypothetical protein BC831DRAFT_485671 [Entophlyctis helioformis]